MSLKGAEAIRETVRLAGDFDAPSTPAANARGATR